MPIPRAAPAAVRRDGLVARPDSAPMPPVSKVSSLLSHDVPPLDPDGDSSRCPYRCSSRRAGRATSLMPPVSKVPSLLSHAAPPLDPDGDSSRCPYRCSSRQARRAASRGRPRRPCLPFPRPSPKVKSRVAATDLFNLGGSRGE